MKFKVEARSSGSDRQGRLCDDMSDSKATV